MSATYSADLLTDKDWVRFLVGDTNVSSANLSDEEITAFLASVDIDNAAAKRYIVAADLLELLHTRWMTRGKGYASKKLGQLSIAFGTGIGINVDTAVQEKIKQLRVKGAKLLSVSIDKPYSFRMLGVALLGLLLSAPGLGQPGLLGIAASAFPVRSTVAQLPAAGSGDHGLRRVTDGASATDCTVGGGSTILLCLDTGAAWEVVGAGGGAPDAHASTHEDGGADEIDVTGLSGVLADAQTPAAHASTHAQGQSDALSGTLAVAVTGNAGTATALAANGANCSAGSYPLGVDASGAVEGCTADDTGTDDQTAAEVPITDAGAYFTGTDVEAALQELGAGGGGSPGGATTQVQFNDAGAFGGDAGLVFDKTTDKLSVGGPLAFGNRSFVNTSSHQTSFCDSAGSSCGVQISKAGGGNEGVATTGGGLFGWGLSVWNPRLTAIATGVVAFGNSSPGSGTWQAGDNGTRPTCDSTTRGRYWHDFGGAGVADSISVCAKDAADAYDWRVIY